MKFNLNNIKLFEWEKLYYHEFEIDIGIYAFQDINKKQEESLATQKGEFLAKIEEDEFYKELPDEEKGGYFTQFYELDERVIDRIETQQGYSMVLSVFSFFEGSLKNITNEIEEKFNFKIKVKDLNQHNDLQLYWNYLAKVYEIDGNSIERYFTPISHHKKVRNIIAHQSGICNSTQRSSVQIGNGLSINSTSSTIQIENSEYIQYLLDAFKVFHEKLLLAVDERFKALKS